MNPRRIVFALAPVAAAAGLGGLGARRAPQTYGRLCKPPWAPPAAVFAPVWSLLYLTIAAAGWRLTETASRSTRSLHLAQLALNAAWPAVFFSLRDKRVSLLVIALLDATLGAELTALRDEDLRAAALLTPYAAWTAFATVLNASVSEPVAEC